MRMQYKARLMVQAGQRHVPDGAMVDDATEVVRHVEGILDADEVPLIPHTPRPVFGRLGHTTTIADGHYLQVSGPTDAVSESMVAVTSFVQQQHLAGNGPHLVRVVVAPGPIVEEGEQQGRQALLVVARVEPVLRL